MTLKLHFFTLLGFADDLYVTIMAAVVRQQFVENHLSQFFSAYASGKQYLILPVKPVKALQQRLHHYKRLTFDYISRTIFYTPCSIGNRHVYRYSYA